MTPPLRVQQSPDRKSRARPEQGTPGGRGGPTVVRMLRGRDDTGAQARTPTSREVLGMSASISGPIAGGSQGRPFSLPLADLAAHGYIAEEYFLDGTASGYVPASDAPVHTRWPVGRGGGRHGRVPHAHPRRASRRPGRGQRHRGGALVERDRGLRARHRRRRSAAVGLCVGRRVGPEGRHRRVPAGATAVPGTAAPAAATQGVGRRAVRVARPSGRRLLLRHLLACRRGGSFGRGHGRRGRRAHRRHRCVPVGLAL